MGRKSNPEWRSKQLAKLNAHRKASLLRNEDCQFCLKEMTESDWISTKIGHIHKACYLEYIYEYGQLKNKSDLSTLNGKGCRKAKEKP